MRRGFPQLKFVALALLQLGALATAQVDPDKIVARVGSPALELEVNGEMYTRLLVQGKALTSMEPTEYLRLPNSELTEFPIQRVSTELLQDKIGKGTASTLIGSARGVEKQLRVLSYEDFPGFLIFEVRYHNKTDRDITVEEMVNNGYRFDVSGEVWSFQGASYEDRYDWVRPLQAGGGEDNFMGMNATDYGGGVPVIDAWTPEGGLAVGLLELQPVPAKLPLDREPDGSNVGMEVVRPGTRTLEAGEQLVHYRSFVASHTGDYYNTLVAYRDLLARLGLPYAEYPDSSYQAVWCGWGYEREVQLTQMLGTLPKAKELGFEWAVLDDGWQRAEGDWSLNPVKFPGGEEEMSTFTNMVRSEGLRPKLWWAPLAADPGTELLRDHPDYLLLNEDGSPREISWWDSYYLCPAYPPVHEHSRRLVNKMMNEWGFDGLKIDGQHLNAAPPCYNPVHQHNRPEEASEAMPKYLKFLHDTALQVKEDAVVEVCPCGTTYALHSLPYTNQPVSSDPESSFQIRLKAKTLKALMGPSVPYYGDHVELSDGGDDFASTVGVGGVIGSKFTLSHLASKPSETDLTPSKELKWKLWSDLYREKQLAKGLYRGELYDLGFDRPEAHVVEKEGSLFYAFYAPQHQGRVELRGLEDRPYRVRDYVRQKDYGEVQGPSASLNLEFSNYLLLEAVPLERRP